MSTGTAKQVRKAARRLAGDAGVQAIQELQQNMLLLANSLAQAHQRIDALQKDIDELSMTVSQRGYRGRLMTVAELLDASHAAHIQYRNAVRENRTSAAMTALNVAYDNRAAAQSADPEHTDSAWHDEAKSFPHDELMKFYESKVG